MGGEKQLLSLLLGRIAVGAFFPLAFTARTRHGVLSLLLDFVPFSSSFHSLPPPNLRGEVQHDANLALLDGKIGEGL